MTMSTLATADLVSDDENDGDFVPAAPKPKSKAKGKRRRGSASGSDSDTDSDSEVDAGELKAEVADAEAEARRARAAAALAEMKAEAAAPRKIEKVADEEMVEVQRPRRFAGETVYETVKLRASDPEAIKLLALQREREKNESGGSGGSGASSSSASPAAGPKPRRKRPRQSLEALAAALEGGKKMTTLEKSQMDWTSHLSKSKSIEDELAANRKSGGYLEKQAFLDRVGERRAAGQDAAKSSRRR
ncbi:unnamed protein product [Cutaneotrichosporon oleaginosum]